MELTLMKTRFGLQIMFLIAVGAVAPDALAQGTGACMKGNAKAPVRLEIFSDYECPGCRAFYLQTMKQVFTNYADKGRICVVYRDFPVYAHSREAARYARAALKVGLREWGLVTEALFQLQPQWSKTGDLDAAVSSALDAKTMAALRKHLKDPTFDDAIDADALEGLKLQVMTTPTSLFTARGKTEKVAGALTYAAMQRRLDALLGGSQTAALPAPNALLAGVLAQ
jgi:protein-disulfide isomerase